MPLSPPLFSARRTKLLSTQSSSGGSQEEQRSLLSSPNIFWCFSIPFLIYTVCVHTCVCVYTCMTMLCVHMCGARSLWARTALYSSIPNTKHMPGIQKYVFCEPMNEWIVLGGFSE